MRPFESDLVQAWPKAGDPAEPVLIAVSGGADSVALAHAVKTLRCCQGCAIAHYNHRLRWSESDGDERFVRQLASDWQIPVYCATAEEPRSDSTGLGEGIESLARDARYSFFNETARQLGTRYVLTAHTADDQVETVLQRIFRGTGISGLAGIPFSRVLSESVSVVRPILKLRRQMTRQYLLDVAIEFRQDQSNFDSRFMRNRIRNELLPRLREQFAENVDDSIIGLSARAAEVQEIVRSQVDGILNRAVECDCQGVMINTRKLADVQEYLVRELLIRIWTMKAWPRQQMSAERWQSAAAMILNSNGGDSTFMLPGAISVRRSDGFVRIERAGTNLST